MGKIDLGTQPEIDFEELVEQHGDFVHNVAYRIVGNSADAEDATQEAFLSAYRNYSGFRGESQVRTWLYRISGNAALMILRRQRRKVFLTQEGYDDMRLVSLEAGPEGSAVNSELRDKLEEGLSQLPPNLRAAVVLRDVEGLSNEEAAEALKASVPSLKARLHRGRVLLRKYLADYVGEGN